MLLVRVLVLGLLGALLATHDQPSIWIVLPAATACAFAVVTEPRAWLRRGAYVAVACGYAVWMLRDDRWHGEWFWQRYALAVLGEAALAMPFFEERLWRWSLIPGLFGAAGLLYMWLPGYAATVVERHALWLVQLLAMLVVSGGWRAIRAEDAEYARRS